MDAIWDLSGCESDAIFQASGCEIGCDRKRRDASRMRLMRSDVAVWRRARSLQQEELNYLQETNYYHIFEASHAMDGLPQHGAGVTTGASGATSPVHTHTPKRFRAPECPRAKNSRGKEGNGKKQRTDQESPVAVD